MNKKLKAIASASAMFVLLLTALVTPSTVLALDSQFSFTPIEFTPLDTSGLTTESESSASVSSSSYTKCVLTANTYDIVTGGSITLNWQTAGFDSLKINGQTVSGNNGSKTFSNLQEDTIYTLVGTNASGSSCTQTVHIACLPPEVPKECKLDLVKTVNKSTAVPTNELTYTVTIKNIGDADCTGGGVKIEDVLDTNLTFVSAVGSSNLTAGYDGKAVYTSADRTIHFNGNVLTPNESGTITVKAKVSQPTACGDFVVKNQAKATAKELNNFQTWTTSNQVKTIVTNKCVVTTPACEMSASPLTIKKGESATLNWSGNSRVFAATIDQGIGSVSVTGSKSVSPLTTTTYTYTGEWGIDDYVHCPVTVKVVDEPTVLTCADYGLETVARYEISGGTLVKVFENSKFTTSVVNTPTPYTWNASPSVDKVIHTGWMVGGPYYVIDGGTTGTVPSGTDIVEMCGTEPEVVAPTCDMFTAAPSAIMVGGTATLSWETTNATQVVINNGVGSVALDGTFEVSPITSVTYKLTAIGAENKTVNCEVPVTVSEDSVPVCKLFTATPNSLPYGGGSVTLNWEIENGATATITPAVGAVALKDSKVVNVINATTFILTSVDADGDEVSCQAPVTVEPESTPFTCANNVSFSASDNSISRGGSSVLTWSTTGVDTVSISGIDATSLSGTQSVSPSSDTTYRLTATKGSESVSCPVSVDVTTGGGGGGTPTPRCELTISDKTISRGDKVTLEWETSNATEVVLQDDKGKVIFTTDDYLSSDKTEYFDSSMKIEPTRDTEYTLIASRGSRDEECSVKVTMEDNVIVLQTRDQQPLVAGISLSQVPYTGFEAGPMLTIFFYLLLVAWALYITYLLVIRRQMAAAGMSPSIIEPTIVSPANSSARAEAVRPDAFVASVVAPVMPISTLPSNLPTGAPVVGYENHQEAPLFTNAHQVSDVMVTELENRAHSQKTLLSSDAIRHFVARTEGTVERNEVLDTVITEAKKMYPLEDGWLVINETRMQNLCEAAKLEAVTPEESTLAPATVPEGTGSLAEAIVTGNIVAAYKMIGNRPMFALADAAADLDAVYRIRLGGTASVSDLLQTEAAKLTDEQIKNIIAALTGALDGTYTDEASAVKMSIMKAVKEVA